MSQHRLEKQEFTYSNEDHVSTQKDLRILSLELEQKILEVKMDIEQKLLHLKLDIELKINAVESSLFKKLGALIVASSGILFGLLSYFHH